MIAEPCHDNRRALTLLELMVVIAILGLVIATVVTRLNGTLGPAVLGQAVSQWEFADRQLRTRAQRCGMPVAMNVEVGTSRLECAFDADDEARRTVRSLGRGVRLEKLVYSTQEVTNGPISIKYTARGTSESYAIELAGRGSARRWFIVAGVTGQISEVPSEAAAREVLQMLLPPGIHAS